MSWVRVLFRKLRAWLELVKLGPFRAVRDELSDFYQGNIVKVFQKEGLFEYLASPRSIEEIKRQFDYKDEQLLKELLEAFVEDGILVTDGEETYRVAGEVQNRWKKPRLYNDSAITLWQSYAEALPNRLRGHYLEFSAGLNLFNWDDVLALKFYEQIRRAAFAFSGALRRTGSFLDVGCGNGFGTAAIWSYYFKKHQFKKPMRIHGIDVNEDLLRIAREEFPMMVEKHLQLPRDKIEAYKEHFPTFDVGSAEHIPFEDDAVDMAYASMVLHWTDIKKSLAEMIRVVKSGGIIFGTHGIYPHANRFSALHCKVVEGATGWCYKHEFAEWAMNAGAKKVEFATPLTVFKITV